MRSMRVFAASVAIMALGAPLAGAVPPKADTGGGTKGIIALDPGHVTKDQVGVYDEKTGILMDQRHNGQEDADAFYVSEKVKEDLEDKGYKVVLVKESLDDPASFRDRVDRAAEANADMAISIHTDNRPVGEVFNQFVGGYREGNDGDGKHKRIEFTNEATAQASTEFSEIFVKTRSEIEGRKVELKKNSFAGRAPKWSGNLPIVSLLSEDVPWVYNEYGNPSGSGGANGIDGVDPTGERPNADTYAKGIVASVEAIADKGLLKGGDDAEDSSDDSATGDSGTGSGSSEGDSGSGGGSGADDMLSGSLLGGGPGASGSSSDDDSSGDRDADEDADDNDSGNGGASEGEGDSDDSGDSRDASSDDTGADDSADSGGMTAREAKVLIIGDSITVGAKGSLGKEFKEATINAKVSRRYDEGLDILKDTDDVGDYDAVVMLLGTNNSMTQEDIDATFDKAGDTPVVLMKVGGPKVPDVDKTNKLVEDNEDRAAAVVDWGAAVQDDGGLLRGDGVHPNEEGAKKFSEMVGDAVTEALSGTEAGGGGTGSGDGDSPVALDGDKGAGFDAVVKALEGAEKAANDGGYKLQASIATADDSSPKIIGVSHPVYAASIIKIPIAVAAINEKGFDEVKDDLVPMIVKSDNDAANRLIDAVGGFDAVNKVIEDAGVDAEDLQLANKLSSGEYKSVASAKGITRFMQEILAASAAEGSGGDSGSDEVDDSSDEGKGDAEEANAGSGGGSNGALMSRLDATALLEIMRKQEVNTKLGAALKGSVLAHKTGEHPDAPGGGVSHDVGVITIDGKEYVLTVMSDGSFDKATAGIKDLGGKIADAVDNPGGGDDTDADDDGESSDRADSGDADDDGDDGDDAMG